MKLTATKRESQTKGAVKQIRRAGKIPAVLYSPGTPAEKLEVDANELNAALREIKSGRLSTTVFTLDLGGKKKKVIVKDIQYNLTSYRVIHLDFEELKDDIFVKMKVPIECHGVADCVGIKSGGFLRQVIRYAKVKCLPKDIPVEFGLNVQDLGMRQVMRLSDIKMPKGVEPMMAADEVVVLIAKR